MHLQCKLGAGAVQLRKPSGLVRMRLLPPFARADNMVAQRERERICGEVGLAVSASTSKTFKASLTFSATSSPTRGPWWVWESCGMQSPLELWTHMLCGQHTPAQSALSSSGLGFEFCSATQERRLSVRPALQSWHLLSQVSAYLLCDLGDITNLCFFIHKIECKNIDLPHRVFM